MLKEEIGKVIRELFLTETPGANCFKVAFPKIVKEQFPHPENYLKALKKEGKFLSLFYRANLIDNRYCYLCKVLFFSHCLIK